MAPVSMPSLREHDQQRQHRFQPVWRNDLNPAFADIAPYYDRANMFASLGLWPWFLRRFMSVIKVQPGQRVLDVCAGTNAVGIALLERERSLEVYALDRSADMQRVGRERAAARGMRIKSTIGDAQRLPFPDNHFDVVTLQWATRHLPVTRAFSEIRRVLKPGGQFCHCDMLPPANPLVGKLYYAYLHICLDATSLMYRSNGAARQLKAYFLEALKMFYTAEQFSHLLGEIGFTDVEARTIFGGMIGIHRAVKPAGAA